MSETNKLAATVRTEFGKGASRRLRRAGQIPAVLYGHGTDPQHFTVVARDGDSQRRTTDADSGPGGRGDGHFRCPPVNSVSASSLSAAFHWRG